MALVTITLALSVFFAVPDPALELGELAGWTLLTVATEAQRRSGGCVEGLHVGDVPWGSWWRESQIA